MPTAGPVNGSGRSDPVPTGPNNFTYLSLPSAGSGPDYVNPISGTGEFPTCSGGTCAWPSNMTRRNAFVGPINWDFSTGIYKNFKVTERVGLQFRGELFNAFNHHNFYVVGDQADVSAGLDIPVKKGGLGNVTDERRNVQLGLKIIF